MASVRVQGMGLEIVTGGDVVALDGRRMFQHLAFHHALMPRAGGGLVARRPGQVAQLATGLDGETGVVGHGLFQQRHAGRAIGPGERAAIAQAHHALLRRALQQGLPLQQCRRLVATDTAGQRGALKGILQAQFLTRVVARVERGKLRASFLHFGMMGGPGGGDGVMPLPVELGGDVGQLRAEQLVGRVLTLYRCDACRHAECRDAFGEGGMGVGQRGLAFSRAVLSQVSTGAAGKSLTSRVDSAA